MDTVERTLSRQAMMTSLALTLVFAICSAAFGGRQQTKQTPGVSPGGSTSQPAGRGSGAVLVTPEEDYRIGPNDVIDVQIDNAPELSRTFRVTAAGTFLMPYIGRLEAAKKTTEELAQIITDKLKGDYLRDPKVTVSVKEYNSRSFFIQGSVRSPGVYQIEGRPSVLELITLASGLSDSHGSNAFIIRRLKQPLQPQTAAASSSTGPATADDQSANDELPRY